MRQELDAAVGRTWMSATITNTLVTSTYVLSNVTQNPLTITSTGTIDVNSTINGAAGILGSAGYAWTVANLGIVESRGTTGIGINLQAGGLIANGNSSTASAVISGTQYGVFLTGADAGTVTNYGSIVATSGTFGRGIFLDAGGTVVNGSASATTALISGDREGIIFSNVTDGTVINFGTIASRAQSSTREATLSPESECSLSAALSRMAPAIRRPD